MSEFMQICKQCGLTLPVDEFKKYPSRGEGLRQTTTGRYTICKHCEKMSAYAAKLQKQFESGEMSKDAAAEREALVNYYQSLVDRGLPLVTKPVRKLMGVPDEPKTRRATSKVMEAIAEARRRMEEVNKYAEKCKEAHPQVQEVMDKIEQIVDPTGDARAKWSTAPFVRDFDELPLHCNEPTPVAPDALINTDKIMNALEVLNELLECEFVREPEYYEAVCDEALQVLRSTTDDGKVPSAYTALASQVLEKLDEYSDNYDD